MAHFIAPSVLAADFTNLSRDLEMINQSEADFLHVDVMDGVFVPAISFGQNIISQMKKICNNKKCSKSEIVIEASFEETSCENCGSELNETDKKVISIIDNNSKYLFHVNDLIKIINASLTNSYMFFVPLLNHLELNLLVHTTVLR